MQTTPPLPVPAHVAEAGVADATGAITTSGVDTGVVLTTLNVADVERTLIARALEMAGGNRTRASELLVISVRTLRNKLNTPADSAEDEQTT
jgi:DNA-binding NtrC family response regulator